MPTKNEFKRWKKLDPELELELELGVDTELNCFFTNVTPHLRGCTTSNLVANIGDTIDGMGKRPEYNAQCNTNPEKNYDKIFIISLVASRAAAAMRGGRQQNHSHLLRYAHFGGEHIVFFWGVAMESVLDGIQFYFLIWNCRNDISRAS